METSNYRTDSISVGKSVRCLDASIRGTVGVGVGDAEKAHWNASDLKASIKRIVKSDKVSADDEHGDVSSLKNTARL